MTASYSCAELSWDSSSRVAGLVSPLPTHNLIDKLRDIVQHEIQSRWENPHSRNHHNLPEKLLALNDRMDSSEIWKCFQVPRQELIPPHARLCWSWIPWHTFPQHPNGEAGPSVGGWGTNLQKTLQNQVSSITPTFPESTHLSTRLGDFTHLKVEAWGTASLVPGCNTHMSTVCTCCSIRTPASNLGTLWNCNRAAVCHRHRQRVKCPFVHFLLKEKVNKNWNSWEETKLHYLLGRGFFIKDKSPDIFWETTLGCLCWLCRNMILQGYT